MFNNNALWWHEYKYVDSAVNYSGHLIYAKHVLVFIYHSMRCCIILHLFDSNAIIYRHLQELHKTQNIKNNINIIHNTSNNEKPPRVCYLSNICVY